MILRHAYASFFASFFSIIFLSVYTQAQESPRELVKTAAESIQLVKDQSDRFLSKLYNIVGWDVLPLEIHYHIAKEIIPTLFTPFKAQKSIKTIPLANESQPDKSAQNYVAFSPDCSHVAVTMLKNFYIFKRKNGKCATKGTSQVYLSNICFNPDGTELAILNTDIDRPRNSVLSKLRRFTLNNYKIVGESLFENGEEIVIENGLFSQIAFTEQNKIVIVGNPHFCVEGSISQLDLENKKLTTFLKARETSNNTPLFYTFNDNKCCIIFTSQEKGIEVFDIKTKEIRTVIPCADMPNFPKGDRCLSFRNSKLIFAAATCTTIWDITSKKKTMLFNEEKERFHPLAFNHNTRFLYGARSGAVHLYHIESGTCVAVFPQCLKPDWACTLSPDGNCLALVTQGKIFLWEWNPMIDMLDDLLNGKLNLEQLLLIKFLHDLRNAGYFLSKNTHSVSEIERLKGMNLNPMQFADADIKQLEEVFLTFNTGIRQYLQLKYFLPF